MKSEKPESDLVLYLTRGRWRTPGQQVAGGEHRENRGQVENTRQDTRTGGRWRTPSRRTPGQQVAGGEHQAGLQALRLPLWPLASWLAFKRQC